MITAMFVLDSGFKFDLFHCSLFCLPALCHATPIYKFFVVTHFLLSWGISSNLRKGAWARYFLRLYAMSPLSYHFTGNDGSAKHKIGILHFFTLNMFIETQNNSSKNLAITKKYN